MVAGVEGGPELVKEALPLSRGMLLPETKHTRILKTV